MTARVVFLGLLLVCVAAAAKEKTGVLRKPQCSVTEEVVACPLNFAPVCATDGVTYPNECVMCVEIQETKKDIWIVKDESC